MKINTICNRPIQGNSTLCMYKKAYSDIWQIISKTIPKYFEIFFTNVKSTSLAYLKRIFNIIVKANLLNQAFKLVKADDCDGDRFV